MLPGATAHGSTVYIQEVQNVEPIFMRSVTLPPGTYTFKTTSIPTPGTAPDPVMRLWDPNQQQEIMKQDDSNGSLDPEFTITLSGTKTYWLIVHAWYQAYKGVANVTITGPVSMSFNNASFAGAKVEINAIGLHDLETVFPPGPNTMHDSMFFGIGCSTIPWTNKAIVFDDDGGVGLQAGKVVPDTCLAIVTPYVNPTNGYSSSAGDLRIIVNDRHISDADNDGLGTQLEEALGTCDNNTKEYTNNGFTFKCADVYNLADSDRDGLVDAQEVLGIDHPTNPQYLPRWGANPAQKDMFIEVDYQTPKDSSQMSLSTLQAIQMYYSKGSAEDLQNPNGQPGIKIHMDIGRSPDQTAPGYQPSDYTLFGSWGGSQQHQNPIDYLTAPDFENVLHPIRRNIFFYFANIMSASGDCGGQADQTDRFKVESSSPTTQCPSSIAHEAGHSLGLEHWGHNSWGQINCKPNYVSIMNYLYDGSQSTQITSTFPGFSTDPMSSIAPMNPAQIIEHEGLGVLYNINNYPGFLTISPFTGLKLQTQTGCSSTFCAVDWNWDDTYTLNTPLRIGITNNSRCSGSGYANAQKLETKDLNITQNTDEYRGSPVLVRSNNFIYLFYVDTNGTIGYYVAPIRTDGLSGSCDGTNDLLEATPFGSPGDYPCLQWSQGTAFETDAGTVNAISFGNKILLTYTKTNNGIKEIHARVISSSNSNGTIDFFGAITIMSGGPSGSATGTPSLSWVRGTSPTISLFYVDAGINSGTHMRYHFNPNSELWNLTPETLQDINNNDLTGPYPVAFVTWPDPSNSESKTCGVVPGGDQQLSFYCLDSGTGKWENMNALAWSSGSPPTSTTQASIAFSFARKTDGTILTNTNGQKLGQFWISYTKNSTNYINKQASGLIGFTKLYHSKTISLSTDFSNFALAPVKLFPRDVPYETKRYIKYNSYTALLADDVISGLKAAAFTATITPTGGGGTNNLFFRSVEFSPFPDNTYRANNTNPTGLTGGNDFRVMEHRLCWNLQSRLYGTGTSVPTPSKANAFCNAKGQGKWGY